MPAIKDKITDVQRESLRGLRADGVSYRRIAADWGVTAPAVRKVAGKQGIVGMTPDQVRQVMERGHKGSLTEADLASIEEAARPIDFEAVVLPFRRSAPIVPKTPKWNDLNRDEQCVMRFFVDEMFVTEGRQAVLLDTVGSESLVAAGLLNAHDNNRLSLTAAGLDIVRARRAVEKLRRDAEQVTRRDSMEEHVPTWLAVTSIVGFVGVMIYLATIVVGTLS